MGRTARTIGAGIVLVLVVIAAITQTAPARLENTLASPDTTATSSTTAQTIPVEPFVYRVGLLAGLTTDNYWAFYGRDPTVWNAYILGPTKPSLYAVNMVDSSLSPELAERHVVPVEIDGEWTVTVPLRQDMFWSDGHPITSVDIVFTFDTVRRLELGGSWSESFPANVHSIEPNGSHSVIIVFSERPTLVTWPHALGTAPIMPSHVWSETIASILEAESLYDIPGSGDVGGGPLAIETAGDGLVVSVANHGYGRSSAPDRVEYIVFPSEDEAIRALEEGRLDTFLTPRGLNPSHLVELDDTLRVVTAPAHGVRYLGFNLERTPMSESAFREALALLLDRQTNTFIDASTPFWYDNEAADELGARYANDRGTRLDLALSGLRTAGFTWGQEPRLDEGVLVRGSGLLHHGMPVPALTILTTGDAWDPERPAQARSILETLEDLGFDARLVETDFDTVVDLAFTRGDDGLYNYDMYILGWSLGDPTLPGFYRTFFGADSPINNTGYLSSDFDAQLGRFESATDEETAKLAVWEMEAILARDLPYLLLYRSTITEVYRQDRISYLIDTAIGGIQGRLGALGDVQRAG